MNLFSLKLTAAVVLNGKIRTAGAIVEVDRATAENLLQRGRAEVATEADEVPSEGQAEALPVVEAEKPAEVATEAAKPAAKTKAKAK